jgi:hypothetical protein
MKLPDHAEQRITAQRAAQDQVRQFLRDVSDEDWPTVRDILSAAITGREMNGAGIHSPPQIQQPAAYRKPNPRVKHGDLTQAVERAVSALRGDLDVQDVLGKLENQGFAVTAKRPAAAVGSVLRKMVDRGQINVAEESSGQKPTIYRKTRRGVAQQPNPE